MNYRPTVSTPSAIKGFQLSLQPAPAWMAILALVFFTTLSILLGAGKILNFAFPTGAFAVGMFLYKRYPILYLGFTWWMWFLAPLIRRLADYRGSFTNPSPILLAPYLVTLVTLVTFWQYLPRANRIGGLPFVMSISGVFYGFLIGLLTQTSPIKVSTTLLDWLVPVTFGFHLFVNWPNYPSYRQNIQRVFMWGVLVMGVYGIMQYLLAPPWDCFWLMHAPIASVGKPEPLEFRVWSTMNAPGPFANAMIAGLLLLVSSPSSLRIPSSIVGYLAFLLTLVRSAWGGWFVGFFTLCAGLKTSLQMRLITTILFMTLCLVPLTTVEQFDQAINTRIETLSSLENDRSATVRKSTYSELIVPALTSFVGEGIGSQSYDTAILTLLLNLGWLGTLPYIGGMLLLILSTFQISVSRVDAFASAARAIVLSIFVQLPLGTSMLAISGVILWGFLGIAMSASKYYQSQDTNSLMKSF